MSELEDFEKRFVVTNDLEKEDLEGALTGLEGWMQVSADDGYVRVIEKKPLSNRQKIHIALASRYLINKLQTKLGREKVVGISMSLEEIARTLRLDKKEVSRRTSDLRVSNCLTTVAKGEVMITPHSIKPLIEELHSLEK